MPPGYRRCPPPGHQRFSQLGAKAPHLSSSLSTGRWIFLEWPNRPALRSLSRHLLWGPCGPSFRINFAEPDAAINILYYIMLILSSDLKKKIPFFSITYKNMFRLEVDIYKKRLYNWLQNAIIR